MMKKFVGLSVVMLVASLWVGCGSSRDGEITKLTGNATNGLVVWGSNCASCHGPAGKGVTGTGPSLVEGHAADHDDAYLAKFILNGEGTMPSFSSSLSNQQIADVIAYIRSLQGK